MLCANLRFVRFALAAAVLLPVSQTPRAAEPDAVDPKTKPNRLAKESSPYLLQHAHNPVDWYPWGAEAFEKAKKEKKIVFLSIGYSSCHWCHVMEKESFSNKEVADILNQNFVCIKVDREERPDVDDIYMNALQVMGARTGWPLSIFLTPDGKPIIGGTYWPREDRVIDGETVSGFKTVLKKMLGFWKDRQEDIEKQADHFATATNDALSRSVRGNAIVDLDRTLAGGAAEAMSEDVDPVHGGIGRKAANFKGTKFPSVSSVAALLDHAVRTKDAKLRKSVELTLDKMAMGGIYDQVGGGFHRYSTERTWTVPHFEKMLYDNAQLVELYAEAFKNWKDPNYARVIRETLAFVKREMTSPEGGFYSALDADSNGSEGEFYVWTPEEIAKVLGDETDAALFRAVYGVNGAPNFEEKFFILRLNKPLVEIAKEQHLTSEELGKKLDSLKAKLLQQRAKRIPPFLDTKLLAAWNGQMIAAYAKAGQVLQDPEYVKTAARAAEFVLKNMRNNAGRLLRTYGKSANGKGEAKLNGYLDDYAFFVHGLLNLHDATGEQRWLDEAKNLTDLMVKWHGDGDKGGFFFTSADHEKLFARPKEFFDNAQPSANGVAARNLVRLGQKTGDERYWKLAEKSFRQFAGVLRANPAGVPSMGLALDLYLDGKPADPEAKEPKKEAPAVAAKDQTTSDVVKIEAAPATATNGKQLVIVTIKIAAPWHIYANGSVNNTPTTLTVRANGKAIAAEIEYPKATKVQDKDVGEYLIYENEIVIKATLPEKVEGPLEAAVKLQACSSGPKGVCLLPTTLKTMVK
jgi:uncharacterized protein